jgi:hypothetical protein
LEHVLAIVRAGSALFSYLTDQAGEAFLPRLLNVVTDNGSDVCSAANCLFQLVNSHLGSRVLLPSNHVQYADHLVQRGDILILTQVKAVKENLLGALVGTRRGKVMRLSYCSEAAHFGYDSKEPTRQDSHTRWNWTPPQM